MYVRSPSANELSTWMVGLYFLLGAIVLYFSFAEHPDCLFTGTDGNLLTLSIETEKLFKVPFSQFGVSPVAGNFDIYFPLNGDYLIGDIVSRILTGGRLSKALTFAASSSFVVICGYAAARAVEASREVALCTGLLIPLVLMPVFQGESTLIDSPLYNIYPYFAEGIGLQLLIISALWHLSGRWTGATIFWMITPWACVTVTMAAQPQTAAVMAPGVAVYGVASLFDAKSLVQNHQRFIAGALVLAGAAVFGYFQYELGLIKSSAYYHFTQEFARSEDDLTFISMIFQGRPGVLILGLACAGALYAILFETRRLRITAIAFLASTGAFLLLAYGLVRWVPSYRGIAPSYVETYLLPFHLLFATIAVVGPLTRLCAWLTRMGFTHVRLVRLTPHFFVASVLMTVAGWNIAQVHAADTWHCQRGGFPISPTPITDYLAAKIQSAPERSFHGLVATFNGTVGQESAHPARLQDASLWYLIGNDHRDVGLWRFHIPTLNQYSWFISAPYYLMLTEFASRPADVQVRNLILLTRINERMLELWGVRYLITDFDPHLGSPIMQMTVPGAQEVTPYAASFVQNIKNPSSIQLLTELSAPNTGNYSPTEIRRADDFALPKTPGPSLWWVSRHPRPRKSTA